MDALALAILRIPASNMATLCSAAAMVFPPGVFITIIPRLVASIVSILSTPAPARPITFKFVPAAKISAVAFVRLRTTKPSYSLISFFRSSIEMPDLLTTETPLVLSYFANISGGRESDTKILYIINAPGFKNEFLSWLEKNYTGKLFLSNK